MSFLKNIFFFCFRYLWIAIFLLGVFLGFIFWKQLNYQIDQALKTGWFAPAVEYYSGEQWIHSGEKISLKQIQTYLIQRNYTLQDRIEKLKKKEYYLSFDCQKQISKLAPSSTCLIWVHPLSSKKIYALLKNKKLQLYQMSPFQLIQKTSLSPIFITQHEGSSFQIRKKIRLNQVPVSCLQAITLTEDQNFLIHKGASVTGIMRAMIRNIKNAKIKEGGSTITQQLIKNRFLSPKRSFKRKWIELIMALILETKLSKDQILELYLNTIYMGQQGSYSLYGFASAAHSYFHKPLKKLSISECALLSIIVQSPGRRNPFKHPEDVKRRRNRVLKKMKKQKLISQTTWKHSVTEPLPTKQPWVQNQSAPYFIDAVQKTLNLSFDQNLKIYTTLRLDLQKKAQIAIQKGLKILEKRQAKSLSKVKKPLQVSLIHVDLKNNHILSLVGGRNFKQSQFNRSIQAERPIGSLVKPFSILSALIRQASFNPLSLLKDEPFINSTWKPKNYKNRYYGEVPLYFALAQSLNTANVRLSLQTGIKAIAKDFQKLGLQKSVTPHPSISLGSTHLSPMEVTQMYATIARMGSYLPLSMITRIQRANGEIFYQPQPMAKQAFPKKKVAVLIGMMKQVIQSGTAKWVQPFLPSSFAGKTGTSNDEKDSWFIGFTPRYLTSVWLGYDDNTSHQLTGSSGALLIWLYFIQSIDSEAKKDFQWPHTVHRKKIPIFLPKQSNAPDQNLTNFQNQKIEDEIELIFEKPQPKRWYRQFF